MRTRPIRTLLFSTLYPSSTRPGHGIFVETRLRELLKTGEVESRVVAPVPWFPSVDPRYGRYATMALTPPAEERHGIAVTHPRYPAVPRVGMTIAPGLLALASIPAIRRLSKSGFDFDLIDAHYFYPDGVAAALLARRFGKPLTITARGTDLNLIPMYVLPRRMMQWAAQQADASIGVCAALVEVLRAWRIDPARLHVLPNGVDLQRFRPLPQEESRRALGIDGAPVLLSVGHLTERKGHHVAVGAMPAVLRRRPEARLIIIGEGEERSRLAGQIHALGLDHAVTLVGAMPNDGMATWYSAADALILASSREGWANVLLEAMACGTPVVATRIWGTPEVLANDDVGTLVDRREAEPFADALLQLLALPRDRVVIRHYAEGFSWAQTSSRQVALFHDIVERRTAAQAQHG
ncbi:MAG: glycosyltransferase family 4 protein [Gemmatimonas sp.]